MNIFKTIAEQHPESVALAFQKHFISAEPTERNLTNAVKLKGEVFCLDVVDAIESEREGSNFLGLFESKEKRATKKAARIKSREAAAKFAAENPTAAKKGFTIDKALAIFSTVAGAAGNILGKPGSATNSDAPDPNQTDRILGIDRNMFYVLAVLGVIILVMVVRKSKK